MIINDLYNNKKTVVAEGPNDGREDNFTIDDIKRLEKIRDLETLKAQAKELIKGKPARRMKPEKISWFYNHIDTLKSPLAVIKMMYDLMLAGEGNKVIGSKNSMASNSYRTRFGEQDMAEDNSAVPVHRIGLTVIDPNHPMVSKRGEQYQKSVRVPGADREKAINTAIAHLRRKGYKVLDHHYIGTVDQGVAEGSEDDIEDTRQFSNAIALAKSQKAIRQAKHGKDTKFYADGTPVTPEETARRAAERKAKKQGMAENQDWMKDLAARAAAKSKPGTPYVPPKQDAEKTRRDLTARYPNIDELVADAERNRDPYYDRAEGEAYYRGREAEQHYQRLRQIQRVIQGLNESHQKKKLVEFKPVSAFGDEIRSRNAALINPATQKPYLPSELAGYQSRRAARKAATDVAEPEAEPTAKPMGTAMPMNPYQVPTANTNPAGPSAVPNTAMKPLGTPSGNTGDQAKSSTDPASELQTIDAPAQLTGPAAAKQIGMNDPNVVDVVARPKTKTSTQQAALPAPAAPVSTDFSKSLSGYGKTTTNTPASFSSGASNMMPTNMMPTAAKTAPKPAVSTTAAKNEILQALKKLGYKTKEAEAAIKQLPPNISTSDAIRQILRGKPTTATESLTWSSTFNPGRSLYRRMKQNS